MPPRVARAQLVEASSSEGGGGCEGSLTVWGNVLISPKHQPFAAAATFDIRSRIPTQTAVAATAAAAACATRSCHAARKNKLDFRPSKTPSVFAAARCLTNVFFDFPPTLLPGNTKKTCSLHFDSLSYFCEIVF